MDIPVTRKETLEGGGGLNHVQPTRKGGGQPGKIGESLAKELKPTVYPVPLGITSPQKLG